MKRNENVPEGLDLDRCMNTYDITGARPKNKSTIK